MCRDEDTARQLEVTPTQQEMRTRGAGPAESAEACCKRCTHWQNVSDPAPIASDCVFGKVQEVVLRCLGRSILARLRQPPLGTNADKPATLNPDLTYARLSTVDPAKGAIAGPQYVVPANSSPA